MARKTYEINIIFSTGDKERKLGKRFTTQKAAREWCSSAGMVPIFGGARPSMFWSAKADRYGRRAIQATIRETGCAFWIDSSTEGRARDAAIRAAI